jgi:hypothetical protein
MRAIVIAAVLAFGCKRAPTAEARPEVSVAEPASGLAPGVSPVEEPSPGAPPPAEEPTPSAIDLPPLETPSESTTAVPTRPAPTEDPFDAATAAVRAQAPPCFGPLERGRSHAASIVVVVSAAGRATRAEASGVDDRSVLRCLEGLATARLWPASSGGRTVRVDVVVKG